MATKESLSRLRYLFFLPVRRLSVTSYLRSLQHHYIQGLPLQSSECPGLTEAASSMGWTQLFHSSLLNEIITKFLNKF